MLFLCRLPFVFELMGSSFVNVREMPNAQSIVGGIHELPTRPNADLTDRSFPDVEGRACRARFHAGGSTGFAAKTQLVRHFEIRAGFLFLAQHLIDKPPVVVSVRQVGFEPNGLIEVG